MAAPTLKDIIIDAYGQALLAARAKGLLGEEAKVAAYRATANVVSNATGKTITPELVIKAVADIK